MCRERWNVEETSLSLRQMDEMVRLVSDYLASWNRLLSEKGMDFLDSDLASARRLAQQLRLQLQSAEQKVKGLQAENDREMTITEYE